MKAAISLISATLLLFASTYAHAQQKEYDVFIPISKYITQSNVEALSAWFDDKLEISILSRKADASKAQAKQILKSFFDSYTPRSFNISHTAGKGNMKYALADLYAGGERFLVTIFVSSDGSAYRIQQIKIDRN